MLFDNQQCHIAGNSFQKLSLKTGPKCEYICILERVFSSMKTSEHLWGNGIICRGIWLDIFLHSCTFLLFGAFQGYLVKNSKLSTVCLLSEFAAEWVWLISQKSWEIFSVLTVYGEVVLLSHILNQSQV